MVQLPPSSQTSESMSSGTTDFLYTPLNQDEIRVLLLLPGDLDSPLRARISHQHFDPSASPLEYEAMSYVWGELGETATLHIVDDASNDIGTIQIRQNLASALRHIRHDTNDQQSLQARSLWCDAVCIDQSNLTERAAQVQRMGAIYRHAQRVIFWLSAEDEDVPRAMNILRNFTPDFDQQLPEADWRSLMTLLADAWFRRLWIRQEIWLANNSALFQSGDCELSWDEFCNGLKHLRSYTVGHQPALDEESQGYFREILETACDVALSKPRVNSFLYMLVMTRHCECEDERDRVYGLLGLQDLLQIEPDYSKTKSARDVYFDYTENYLRTVSIANILSMCEMVDNPSWVPDLTVPVPSLGVYGIGSASSNTKTVYSISADRTLTITGTHVGTITRKTSPMPPRPSLEDVQRTFASWVAASFPQGIQAYDGAAVDDMIATIARGHLKEDIAFDDTSLELWQLKDVLLSGVPGHSPQQSSDLEAASRSRALDVFSKSMTGTQLVRTTLGKFALGTGAAREGDEIFVILGCNMPIIMRPVGSSKYRIVGACFMHSLMRFEGLLGPLPEGWRMIYKTFSRPVFIHPSGMITINDPRLEELPDGWEQKSEQTGRLLWRYGGEGDWEWFDPRMAPDRLSARGLRLVDLTIV
ncbi:hypothetical protein COL26b_013809 [Colletotrichum chrysophilum]|uniref:uncharacterized protein n=1 Tax=Colletotrichum chrysophilum TaxID=1836956 RepID=UPI0023012503|nr:uncharacterized protein COL26b_013809 [Colletotrichum chrysophilum]KAJ0361223.1 hypothetical protein COL26b_013809 [Colletotrichum chrysophilum]